MQAKKVFWHVMLHSYSCNTLYKFFLSKSKVTNVFSKHFLKSKTRDQSIQVTKTLFCHITVNNCLCSVFCMFLIKIESKWSGEIQEQTLQLTLLYSGRTIRSSQWRCSVKKAVFKNLAMSTRKISVEVSF